MSKVEEEKLYKIPDNLIKKYTNKTHCPYCNYKFKKKYFRSFKCENCLEKIFLKNDIYLTHDSFRDLKLQLTYLDIRESSLLIKRIEFELNKNNDISLYNILYTYYEVISKRYLEIQKFDEYSWFQFQMGQLHLDCGDNEMALLSYFKCIYFEIQGFLKNSVYDSTTDNYESFVEKIRKKYSKYNSFPNYYLYTSPLNADVFTNDEWTEFILILKKDKDNKHLEFCREDIFNDDEKITRIAPERWMTMTKLIIDNNINFKKLKVQFIEYLSFFNFDFKLYYSIEKVWELLEIGIEVYLLNFRYYRNNHNEFLLDYKNELLKKGFDEEAIQIKKRLERLASYGIPVKT